MMSEGEGWKRLHPASPLFHLFGLIRALAFTMVLVFVVSSGDKTELLLGLGLVIAAAYHLYKYFVTRYRLTDDELVIRGGVVFKTERHIPISSINNIDLVRNPVARWLGVAEARVQTASGGEAEAVLRVIGLADVERIRNRLTMSDRSEPNEPAPERPLHTMGIGEVVRLGLVNNRGLAVFAGAMGVSWQIDLFDKLDVSELFDRVAEFSGPLTVVLGVAALVVVFMVFSVVLSVLRFNGFELRRVGDDFRITCGLFTQRAATIPRSRVQLVSVRSTPLHRVFGRVGVRVETAGGVGDQGSVFGRSWFMPLATTAQADRVIGELGFGSIEELDWNRPAAGTTRRVVKKALIVSVPIGLALAGIGWASGLPMLMVGGLAVVGLSVLQAVSWVRRMRWCVNHECSALRSGVVVRSVSVARRSAGQIVAVTESPFDRRRGMAKLRIDTAGSGPAGHQIEIPYLLREDAIDRARAAAGWAGVRGSGVSSGVG